MLGPIVGRYRLLGFADFRSFRILITGESSGLVETITDAVSIHSIKKGEYAKRIAEGGAIGHASLMDHFVNVRLVPDLERGADALADLRQSRHWTIRSSPAKLYQVSRWLVQSFYIESQLTVNRVLDRYLPAADQGQA